MWKSQVIEEWRTEGRTEGQVQTQRRSLLKVLARLQSPVPADLAEAIQQNADPDSLERWFDAALAASSVEAFRAAIQALPNGAQ